MGGVDPFVITKCNADALDAKARIKVKGMYPQSTSAQLLSLTRTHTDPRLIRLGYCYSLYHKETTSRKERISGSWLILRCVECKARSIRKN